MASRVRQYRRNAGAELQEPLFFSTFDGEGDELDFTCLEILLHRGLSVVLHELFTPLDFVHLAGLDAGDVFSLAFCVIFLWYFYGLSYFFLVF